MSDLFSLAGYFVSEDATTLEPSVRAAEAAGYRRAWLNDAQTLHEDVYIHMSRVLDRTERIIVGSGVVNPVTRHFTVAAGGHGTLAKLHPGRVVLGFGRGDAAVHTIGLKPMKTEEFREVVASLKRLLRGDSAPMGNGTDTSIRWMSGIDVPLMLAATGPKNLQIAGAVADIVQIQVGVSPEAVEWAMGHVYAGAEAAGRDPAKVEISVLCAMWLANDVTEARDRCRWAAVTAANHIKAVTRRPDHGMPERLVRVVEERDRRGDHAHDYDAHLENKGAQTEFLTDDLIDDFAIAGNSEWCKARIAALRELGVAEVATGFLNNELDQIAKVGREVIGPLTGAAVPEPPSEVPQT